MGAQGAGRAPTGPGPPGVGGKGLLGCGPGCGKGEPGNIWWGAKQYPERVWWRKENAWGLCWALFRIPVPAQPGRTAKEGAGRDARQRPAPVGCCGKRVSVPGERMGGKGGRKKEDRRPEAAASGAGRRGGCSSAKSPLPVGVTAGQAASGPGGGGVRAGAESRRPRDEDRDRDRLSPRPPRPEAARFGPPGVPAPGFGALRGRSPVPVAVWLCGLCCFFGPVLEKQQLCVGLVAACSFGSHASGKNKKKKPKAHLAAMLPALRTAPGTRRAAAGGLGCCWS